ncbi:MAG TPA: BTAD domain-containing putative transcriptional regulator [archaeon]|nr:BTAD domain-containing putative transcriptional regulator [archaeon]
MHRAADGWAAGLVLILEWLRREEVRPQALKKASARQILDYFGNEIFDKVDHPTQDFLLRTALMPRMTARMAEALSGLPAAANILSRLSSQNTFTERRLHQEPVYQYHSLFLEFLLSRGSRSFAPDELAALRCRAAGLLEEGGETEHAAAVLCEAGDWELVVPLILKHAPALLVHGRHRALETKAPLAEFMGLLAQARMAFDRGDDRSGLVFLKKVLALGAEKGYVNTYYWQPPVMASLCKRALDAGIEVRYVQGIIRKRHLMPDPPPYECALWPWPLRVYGLGGFRLERDGEPIAFSGKVRQKPLLLLKALIALGGKDVKEEQLSDALWPEADGDAAHSAFTTTLSRLRDLLGAEKAIRIQEGRATLDPRYCWVDAWAFERLLAEAEGQLKDRREGREQEAVRRSPLEDLFGKATALYNGHFLAGDEAHVWTTSYRERLRGKFLRLIVRWREHPESVGKWKDAAECYQRGLEVDDLAEEFYQRLMLCYQQLGLRGEAIAAYRRCQKVLSRVLGVEPSPKTEAIYRSLTSNQ